MSSKRKEPVIGIDLGTTNSLVGVSFNGRVEILENEHGKRSTLSCVTYRRNQCLVGDAGTHQEQLYSMNTISDFKRMLGKRYSEIRHLKTSFSIKEDNQRPKIEIKHGSTATIEEVCGMVIKKLKKIAEAHLDCEVTRAVISVPAHFTTTQRQATLDAARFAGINVSRLINETTAAALAFASEKKLQGMHKVLVYDLGGRSLGVSVVEIKNGVQLKVLATAGNAELGGEDFTAALLDFAAMKYLKETGIDIRPEVEVMIMLKDEAEKAKQALSISNETLIVIESVIPGIQLDVCIRVTRQEFEDACSELLPKLLLPCEKVLKDLSLNGTDTRLDGFVLVGGASRMPMVQKMLQNQLKCFQLNFGLPPEDAVVYGATLLTANPPEHEIIDITSFKLGYELQGPHMTVLFEEGSTLPCARVVKMSDSHLINSKKLKVYEGPSTRIEENIFIEEFPIESDPAKIEIDQNGILTVQFSSNKKEIPGGTNLEKVCLRKIQTRITDQTMKPTAKVSPLRRPTPGQLGNNLPDDPIQTSPMKPKKKPLIPFPVPVDDNFQENILPNDPTQPSRLKPMKKNLIPFPVPVDDNFLESNLPDIPTQPSPMKPKKKTLIPFPVPVVDNFLENILPNDPTQPSRLKPKKKNLIPFPVPVDDNFLENILPNDPTQPSPMKPKKKNLIPFPVPVDDNFPPPPPPLIMKPDLKHSEEPEPDFPPPPMDDDISISKPGNFLDEIRKGVTLRRVQNNISTTEKGSHVSGNNGLLRGLQKALNVRRQRLDSSDSDNSNGVSDSEWDDSRFSHLAH